MSNIDLTQVDIYLMNWRDNYFFGKYLKWSSHYFAIKKDNSGWDIIPYGSQKWDSIDQQMWKGHDIDESYGEGGSKKYVPDWLPPIPTLEELQAVPSMKWKDNFHESEAYPAENFPYLKKYFEENNLTEKTLYFALTEDVYESKFGDGVFRYLKKASFDKQEILDFVATCKEEEEFDMGNGRKGTKYGKIGFANKHTIELKDAKFWMPDFAPVLFEHYKFEELLEMIEKNLIQQ